MSTSRRGRSRGTTSLWRASRRWPRLSSACVRIRGAGRGSGGPAGALRSGTSSRLRRRWTRSRARRPRSCGRRTTTRPGSTPLRSRSRAGISRSRAASWSGTATARRPACCARSRRGSSARASRCPRSREFVDATREGLRLAATRGVTAIHDKDGWLGAAGIFQRIHADGGLPLRVWQSVPYERLPELEALGLRSGVGDDFLRIGYLKAFMDGTLGSQTAWMLDGSGVVITSGEELREIVRAGARAGWPVGVHAIGDRANREALDAFEATREEWAPLGLRQRIEHAQCLAPEDVGRFAALGVACSVQFSHAPSDRDLAERFWGERVEGAYAFRSLLGLGRARRQRLGRAGRGARPARGDPGRRAAHDRRARGVASRAAGDGRGGAARDDASTPPGSRATSAAAAASSPATSPTSSCSRATRSTARRTSSSRSRSWRRWSAAAGRTTRRPGTEWDARSTRRRAAALRQSGRGYDRGRPGHADEVYGILRDRCGVGPGSKVLEVGPGTGQAIRAAARARRRPARGPGAGPRARRASSANGSATRRDPREHARGRRARGRLRPGRGGLVLPLGRRGRTGSRSCVTRCGLAAGWRSGGRRPATGTARTRSGKPSSPSSRSAAGPFERRRPAGRPSRTTARHASPRSSGAGFDDVAPVRIEWTHTWDTEGIRGLFGSFSPILALEPGSREALLDSIAHLADTEFGGRVTKPVVTALYTARKPV